MQRAGKKAILTEKLIKPKLRPQEDPKVAIPFLQLPALAQQGQTAQIAQTSPDDYEITWSISPRKPSTNS